MSNSRKPVAWVTGAKGLIGNYVVNAAAEYGPNWEVVGLDRRALDLSDYCAVEKRFLESRPQLIIHCAAISRSPVCQENPALAWSVNFELTRHLANLAKDVPFIFLSSDLVFDGCKGHYVETDEPNPLSVYAETKVAAEKVILANPRHTVIRVSLNAGVSLTRDRAFNEEIKKAWEAGKSLKLFDDEFRCPIPAVYTARAIWELANSKQQGVFHIAGAERLSRLEIGKLLASRWPELNPKIERSTLREYQGAPRPPDVSLDCHKISRSLSFALPRFSSWVCVTPEL